MQTSMAENGDKEVHVDECGYGIEEAEKIMQMHPCSMWRTKCLSFSPPDGRMLACGCGSELVIYSVINGDVISFCRGHNQDPVIHSVCFGLSDKLLLAVCSDGFVEIFSDVEAINDSTVDDLALVLDAQFSRCLSFSSGSKQLLLAVGSDDSVVHIFEAASHSGVNKKFVLKKGHVGGIESVAWDLSSTRLASAGRMDGTVRIWDAERGLPLQDISVLRHCSGCLSVCFVSESSLAAGFDDGCLKIWNFVEDEIEHESRPHSDSINSICCFSSKGVVCTGSSDKSICIFSAAASGNSLDLVQRIEGEHEDAVHSVCLSTCSSSSSLLLASAGGETDADWHDEGRQIMASANCSSISSMGIRSDKAIRIFAVPLKSRILPMKYSVAQ